MKARTKNILIFICVPLAVSAVYFGAKATIRQIKTKNLIGKLREYLISKSEAKTLNEKDGFNNSLIEQTILQWRKELKNIDEDEFNSFYEFFLLKINKNSVKDDKEIEKINQNYAKHKNEISKKSKLIEFIEAI